MIDQNILVSGARVHNLKNISVKIPKNKMVVFTGVSGSGKSSLVFDTIYTEAQRQLIETFSSFARSRMPKLSKPDIDEIKNISTAIMIDQKRMGTSLRSTVGTATEIYTYMRLLFSRCGDPQIGPSFFFGFNHPLGMCPDCKGLGKKIQIDIDQLIDKEKTIREGAINHPDYKVDGWNYREIVGIKLINVDKKIKDFSPDEINDFLYAKAIPIEKKHGEGLYTKNYEGIVRKLERLYINKAKVQLSKERRDAYEKYFNYSTCITCKGARINEKARSVTINGKSIPELVNMELSELYHFLKGVSIEIAKPIITKMCSMLLNLIEIGVGYLSLNRNVATLSGGESQRVKIARQLDCDLVDIMYILDEPTIGLHPRDTFKIIDLLKKLRDKGNSLLIVEHDKDVIKNAEYIVDLGPQAGSNGGEIIYTGNFEGLLNTKSITASIFNKSIPQSYVRKKWNETFIISNVNVNNLKNISTRIPKGVFTCITGVAGSGKSSLIIDTFIPDHPEAIVVDQTPVSVSSRSIPLTYIDVFSNIRNLFAKKTNSKPGLFSFNSKGACPKCKGLGYLKVEMHFLDEVRIICDICEGKRYQEEVLKLTYKDRNIYEVLRMTVKDGLKFFSDEEIIKKIQVLSDVGLDYLEMGQPLSTLSGGEAQRIKLASELHKKGNLYIMDEPTTGLHIADIEKLIGIIKILVTNNNTVIVIEHNLDIIKEADWIIDLGPEGGTKGGEILFEGIPEDLIKCEKSFTGKYLKEYFL